MKATVRVLIADGTPDSSGNIVRAEGVTLPEGEVTSSNATEPTTRMLMREFSPWCGAVVLDQ